MQPRARRELLTVRLTARPYRIRMNHIQRGTLWPSRQS
jgi:hypothetical protein